MAKTAEVISIGTELLQGAVLDTNSTYISRLLLERGLEVKYRTTVGDNRDAIRSTIEIATGRADVIICTGGLGPTVDDMTVETVADMFDMELVFDPETKQKVERFYKMIGVPATPNGMNQARVPGGAAVVNNPVGTAPGVYLERAGKRLFLLPGVPREMKAMMTDVIGLALEGEKGLVFKSRSLREFGVGESNLETMIPSDITESGNPTFSFLPHRFEVEMRLTAHGDMAGECERILEAPCARIYEAVGDYIYGEGEVTLEEIVVGILKEKGLTLSVAESCTGGLIGSRLTKIAGSSAAFRGGIICYTAELKTGFLDVPEGLIAEKGVVSEETAVAMARGAVARFGTDLAVSVTGNAGPTSDDDRSEVGQVYVAVAFKEQGRAPAVVDRRFKRPRNDVRAISAQIGLDLVRRCALGIEPLR